MTHWTDNVNINKSFLEELYEFHGNEEFTNRDAYLAYAPHTKTAIDEFTQMNVRNILGAAAYRGLLRRVRPGVYRFTRSPENFWDWRSPTETRRTLQKILDRSYQTPREPMVD